MARTARASVGGVCYHALNRGNGRAEVFHKKEDYIAFLDLMGEAGERLAMRLLAWCLIRMALACGGNSRNASGGLELSISKRDNTARRWGIKGTFYFL